MGKGFAILSIASIAVKILSLLFIPILRNLFGSSANYGVYIAAYTIFSYIYLIANSGFPVAISKYISELSEQRYHKAALRTFKIARFLLIIIGTVLGILMAILSKPIANAIGHPEAYLGILALAPCILITAILSAYRGYFQGRQKMSPTGITQVIEQIVHILISITLVYFLINDGLEFAVAGASLGTVAGALAALAIIIFMFRKYYNEGYAVTGDSRKSPYTYSDIAKVLIKYSVPITLCVAIQQSGNLIDTLNSKNRLVASGLSEELAGGQYGMLATSQQLLNVPLSLIIALSVAMLPSIASALAVDDKKSAFRNIKYCLRLCYIVSIPFAFGIMILNGGLYGILKYNEGAEILMYASLSIILLATSQIQTSILQSVNRLYYAIFSMFIGAVIKILLNHFLIPIPGIGIYGAIISTYISTFIIVCINQYIIRKKEGIDIRLIPLIWRPLSASIYMGGAISVIYYIPSKLAPVFFSGYIENLLLTGVAAIAGIFVYFITMAKLKGLTKKDIQSISGFVYRKMPSFMKNMLS